MATPGARGSNALARLAGTHIIPKNPAPVAEATGRTSSAPKDYGSTTPWRTILNSSITSSPADPQPHSGDGGGGTGNTNSGVGSPSDPPPGDPPTTDPPTTDPPITDPPTGDPPTGDTTSTTPPPGNSTPAQDTGHGGTYQSITTDENGVTTTITQSITTDSGGNTVSTETTTTSSTTQAPDGSINTITTNTTTTNGIVTASSTTVTPIVPANGSTAPLSSPGDFLDELNGLEAAGNPPVDFDDDDQGDLAPGTLYAGPITPSNAPQFFNANDFLEELSNLQLQGLNDQQIPFEAFGTVDGGQQFATTFFDSTQAINAWYAVISNPDILSQSYTDPTTGVTTTVADMLSDPNVTITIFGIPGDPNIGTASPLSTDDSSFNITYDPDNPNTSEIIAHELGHVFSYYASQGLDIDSGHTGSPSYPTSLQNIVTGNNNQITPH